MDLPFRQLSSYSDMYVFSVPKGLLVPTENRSRLDADIAEAVKDVAILDTLSHLLRRAHFRNEYLFSGIFGETGLTSRQMVLLVAIAQNPGVSQKVIGDIVALDVNTVSDTLRRMERKHLIERISSKADGRSVVVRLTSDGLKTLKDGMSRNPALQNQVAERLNPDEAADLKMLLQKVLGVD